MCSFSFFPQTIYVLDLTFFGASPKCCLNASFAWKTLFFFSRKKQQTVQFALQGLTNDIKLMYFLRVREYLFQRQAGWLEIIFSSWKIELIFDKAKVNSFHFPKEAIKKQKNTIREQKWFHPSPQPLENKMVCPKFGEVIAIKKFIESSGSCNEVIWMSFLLLVFCLEDHCFLGENGIVLVISSMWTCLPCILK